MAALHRKQILPIVMREDRMKRPLFDHQKRRGLPAFMTIRMVKLDSTLRSTLVALAMALAPSLGLAQESEKPDIALIIIDDIGVDRIAAYAAHPDPGNTPNIDRLAESGLLFRRAYANPLCSPTRAMMLTGRYSFRTEIGTIMRNQKVVRPGLSIDEVSIPDALPKEYRSSAFGKWHLGNKEQFPSHPLDLGFDYFSGTRSNLNIEPVPGSEYFCWRKTVMGKEIPTFEYATKVLADDVIEHVAKPGGPDFLWIAPHAAHTPLHAPPDDLHSFELSGEPADTPVEHGKAIIEALDAEIGRILKSLDPNTIVIVIGDNGTSGEITSAPYPSDHGKGTVHEGGVHVPLIISGPGVTHGECDAMVLATDLFATIVELAGGESKATDSISLLPYFKEPAHASLRETIYVERFKPNGPAPYKDWMQGIRGERFKLIRSKQGEDQFYDLREDPFEQQDLIALDRMGEEEQSAFDRLASKLPHRF
ncbi:MAG: arylsulfatase A-like enzyme [Planctomycetota bacterium]|jgi:arylsulfatase A-like enzyme